MNGLLYVSGRLFKALLMILAVLVLGFLLWRLVLRPLHALTGYEPEVMLEDGLKRFVQWYREFYGNLAPD